MVRKVISSRPMRNGVAQGRSGRAKGIPVSQPKRRAYRIARTIPCLALVGSLLLQSGCAKLHKKLHKHQVEPVFGTYPATDAPYAGLASVSPQTAPIVAGPPIIYNAPGQYSPTGQIQPNPTTGSQPADTKPAEAPAAAPSPPVMPPMDQPPPPEAPKAVAVPAEAKPAAAPAAKPAEQPKIPAPAAPAAEAPPAKPAAPAAAPGINLPPPSNDLPLLPPPVDLPPPASAPPRSTSVAPPAATGGSPFAGGTPAASARVATNQPVTNSPVLTLSQPGPADAPPPAPADERPMPPLAAPAQPTAPAAKPAATGVKTSSTAAPRNSEVAKLDAVLQRTSATLSATANYKVDVKSQESVNGKMHPVDQFVLYKRRQPFAVRMEWSQGNEAGREVIFSPTETKGMIQIRMPKGLIPRISMSPDSPLVRAKSRHPITEAGIDSVVERLNETLSLSRKNAPNAGQIAVAMVNDPTLGPLQRITHLTTKGETWVVDMQNDTGLPLTVHATDNAGQLMEHYEFRNYQLNLGDLQTASAFDPNARWGQPKLLGNLARGKGDDSTKR